jgi:hypothetical protein
MTQGKMIPMINRRLFFGVIFILAGLLILLKNIKIINLPNLVWGILFISAGLLFLSNLLKNRSTLWVIFPGFGLSGIGGAIIISDIPGLTQVSHSFLLAFIGISFWIVYLNNRNHWWAILPGGVMFTLALIAGFRTLLGIEFGGVFLIGLALTFTLLSLLQGNRKMNWPYIPAGILAFFGLLLTTTTGKLANIIGPAALVLIGLIIIFRAFIRR